MNTADSQVSELFRFIEEAARPSLSSQVQPVHILLALMRQDTLGVKLLHDHGVVAHHVSRLIEDEEASQWPAAASARQAINNSFGPQAWEAEVRNVPFSEESKRILNMAGYLAAQEGEQHIFDAALLAVIAMSAACRRILRTLNVAPEEIHEQLVHILPSSIREVASIRLPL
jgi:ATP-dependent Clp protease ATP-binding subunit ClpA